MCTLYITSIYHFILKHASLMQNSSVGILYISDTTRFKFQPEKMASRRTASMKFDRKCEICGRSNQNGRMLGPLIHTRTISAHYNCVLFSPTTVDANSLSSGSEDSGICGVTSRFIRSEGSRAKKLVCSIFSPLIRSSDLYFISLSFTVFS